MSLEPLPLPQTTPGPAELASLSAAFESAARQHSATAAVSQAWATIHIGSPTPAVSDEPMRNPGMVPTPYYLSVDAPAPTASGSGAEVVTRTVTGTLHGDGPADGMPWVVEVTQTVVPGTAGGKGIGAGMIAVAVVVPVAVVLLVIALVLFRRRNVQKRRAQTAHMAKRIRYFQDGVRVKDPEAAQDMRQVS